MIKLNIRNIYDEVRLSLFWPSWEIVSQITTGFFQSEEYLPERRAFDAWLYIFMHDMIVFINVFGKCIIFYLWCWYYEELE